MNASWENPWSPLNCSLASTTGYHAKFATHVRPARCKREVRLAISISYQPILLQVALLSTPSNTQLDLGWTDALQYMQGSVDQPVQDNGVLTGVAETVVELQLLQQYGLRQPDLQQVRCYVVAHCSCTVSLSLMLVERSHATCSPDVRGQSNN